MSEVAWPSDIENLASDDELPNQVTMFLENLLKPTGKPLTEKLTRFINSFASDFVSAIGGGKITTAKHFLVVLGLHNLTGQKKVVQILHKLGHCMNYDLTCEIETSQAKLALEQQSSSSISPLLPKNNVNYVLTYFWVGNVDRLVELMQGDGSVHSTHLVAFQEHRPYSMKNSQKKYFSRQKKRTLELPDKLSYSPTINPKKEPPLTNFRNQETNNYNNHNFQEKYLIWLLFRLLNDKDQTIPTTNGWQLNLRKQNFKGDIKKTIVTYLPPIAAKVTEFETIYQHLSYLQELSLSANMIYVNITLNIGAAMNCYKVIWNYQYQFSDIVIHPGDFHFIKEHVLIIGTLDSMT